MSVSPRTHRATQALRRLRRSEEGARDELLELVYDDLRRIAERSMRRERSDHTLQPTALVHEAYLRLFDEVEVEWQDRSHFFGVAASCIRRILVAHARERAALKRGGHLRCVPLHADAVRADGTSDIALLQLEEALVRLAEKSERQVRVVELRYFGGLSVPETAEALGLSERTVKSDWQVARLWLHRELAG